MSNQTTWTGFNDNDWLNAKNWSKGVPGANLHALIPPMQNTGRYPVIKRNLKINFTLKNEGELSIQAEVLIMQNGILQNYGKICNDKNSLVLNSGNVINFGEWINEGTLANKNIFNNQHRCFNEGTIENHHTFVNMGSVVNTGAIENFQLINNNGTLENFNSLENHEQGMILNEAPKNSENDKKMEAIFHTLGANASTSV